MSGKNKLPRRDFLKQAAGVIGATTQAGSWTGVMGAEETQARQTHLDPAPSQTEISYPRIFEGRQLKMISFPLGGVAAGSLGLGGRGQLRDWEIFNRPNQGGSFRSLDTPSHTFGNNMAAANMNRQSRAFACTFVPSTPIRSMSGIGRGCWDAILHGLAHLCLCGITPVFAV